jgi:hypothetical protein
LPSYRAVRVGSARPVQRARVEKERVILHVARAELHPQRLREPPELHAGERQRQHRVLDQVHVDRLLREAHVGPRVEGHVDRVADVEGARDLEVGELGDGLAGELAPGGQRGALGSGDGSEEKEQGEGEGGCGAAHALGRVSAWVEASGHRG